MYTRRGKILRFFDYIADYHLTVQLIISWNIKNKKNITLVQNPKKAAFFNNRPGENDMSDLGTWVMRLDFCHW